MKIPATLEVKVGQVSLTQANACVRSITVGIAQAIVQARIRVARHHWVLAKRSKVSGRARAGVRAGSSCDASSAILAKVRIASVSDLTVDSRKSV